jgi:Rad3-related DNA helicase
MLGRMGRFANSATSGDWIAWTSNENIVTIRPLTPRLHAGRMLFDHAEMLIIMSATILDFKTFARNLGIGEQDCEFLALPSDFAKENREIHYRPVGSMAYAHQDATLQLLADFVRTVLLQLHPREKGIVHTHTRKINKYLVEALRDLASRVVSRPRVLAKVLAAERLGAQGPARSHLSPRRARPFLLAECLFPNGIDRQLQRGKVACL